MLCRTARTTRAMQTTSPSHCTSRDFGGSAGLGGSMTKRSSSGQPITTSQNEILFIRVLALQRNASVDPGDGRVVLRQNDEGKRSQPTDSARYDQHWRSANTAWGFDALALALGFLHDRTCIYTVRIIAAGCRITHQPALAQNRLISPSPLHLRRLLFATTGAFTRIICRITAPAKGRRPDFVGRPRALPAGLTPQNRPKR